MQIFVDMDGVLADFDSHHEAVFGVRPCKQADNVDWQAVRAVKNYYLDMPPMPDMRELWDFVAPHKPIVLTGVPINPITVEEAPANKRAWAAKHLGPDVEVRTCPSKDKSLHCQPGDILLDDWPKYRDLWVAKGGIWITHTSAKDSIVQLAMNGIGVRPS